MDEWVHCFFTVAKHKNRVKAALYRCCFITHMKSKSDYSNASNSSSVSQAPTHLFTLLLSEVVALAVT